MKELFVSETGSLNYNFLAVKNFQEDRTKKFLLNIFCKIISHGKTVTSVFIGINFMKMKPSKLQIDFLKLPTHTDENYENFNAHYLTAIMYLSKLTI